jgi:hypothetical protein
MPYREVRTMAASQDVRTGDVMVPRGRIELPTP